MNGIVDAKDSHLMIVQARADSRIGDDLLEIADRLPPEARH
jgi:hypothetical protein